MEGVVSLAHPGKTKRSLSRFNRWVASYRRDMLRRFRRAIEPPDLWAEREVARVPTRAERRIDEALRQDLRDTEMD